MGYLIYHQRSMKFLINGDIKSIYGQYAPMPREYSNTVYVIGFNLCAT